MSSSVSFGVCELGVDFCTQCEYAPSSFEGGASCALLHLVIPALVFRAIPSCKPCSRCSFPCELPATPEITGFLSSADPSFTT